MNKFFVCTSACALTLGMASVAAAQDLDRGEFSASVSATVAPSGFSQSAGVGVAGFGAGAASVTNTVATFKMLGTATAGRDGDEAFAGSGIASDFDLNRDVQISGSGIGAGAVFASGNSTGMLGFSGLASGASESGFIDAVTGDQSRKAAKSDSDGSIEGIASTSLGLEMIATSNSFVGSLATENISRDRVAVRGLNYVTSDDESILISPFEASALPAPAFGALFANAAAGGSTGFNFTQSGDGLDLSVANLGGGSMQITGDVKGFFGGGFGSSAATQFGTITP